jgi:EAL domain-containing protein (putative c-di-GMP-specific phosphodiesterase class I)
MIQSCTVKQSLTKAMVHFANEMEAFLVAEGVETAAEHETLKTLGVRLGQGYYYARPTEAAEAARMMREFYEPAAMLQPAS